MQGLKDGHPPAQARQFPRTGEARRPGPHHRGAPAVPRNLLGHGASPALKIVRRVAFQVANAHRLALDAAHTVFLALVLLRAHTAAHRGQRRIAGEDVPRALIVALGDFADKTGDVNAHRAAPYARPVLALQAASGLLTGHGGVIAGGYLLKVAGPLLRVAGRQGHAPGLRHQLISF